jgi:hypothetical protein
MMLSKEREKRYIERCQFTQPSDQGSDDRDALCILGLLCPFLVRFGGKPWESKHTRVSYPAVFNIKALI